MGRVVVDEILDSLDPADPDARRSREDLLRINRLMGNYRWLASRMRKAERRGPRTWVELGAGDGPLVRAVGPRSVDRVNVTGIDLQGRPESWPETWPWRQGDLFHVLESDSSLGREAGLAAILFLHHLDGGKLLRLGGFLEGRFNRIVCCEPARYGWCHVGGSALRPFINEVTRHDMHVSIDAGFRPGELAEALGLGRGWRTRDSVTPLGAYRFEAWRE